MKIYDSWRDYYSNNKLEIKNFGKLLTPIVDSISFIDNEKYLNVLNSNKNIIGLIGSENIYDKLKSSSHVSFYIKSTYPLKDFLDFFNFWLKENSVKTPSSISKSCKIHNSAIINKNNVIIEENVLIEENVVIKENVTIKKGTIIRSSCVLGSEGFEVVKIDGKNKHIEHNGNLIIGENVQLQVNCIVDKGAYGQDTKIGNHTMLDNNIHIGHNTTIGDNCLITAGVIISGNVKIKDNVYIGPGSIISNRITIGNNVKIKIGSTVIKDIEDNIEVSGHFAIPHKDYLKQKVMLRKMIKK